MSQGTPVDADTQRTLLAQCESCVGYVFRDKNALLSALTHASSAEHRLASNERLEFLGDAILGMVVCEILYLKFPEYSEGDLTRVKSSVVSRQACARISARLGLERYLILGKGMAGSDRLPSSLLADVFESLIAAIYLDGGHEPARAFVEREIAPEIEAAVQARGEDNYKSQLQQLAQRDYGSTPVYQLLDERGPDHSKCFQVAAKVGQRQFAPAWGRNKKEAEQLAARHALQALTELDTSLSSPAADIDNSPANSGSPETAGCSG